MNTISEKKKQQQLQGKGIDHVTFKKYVDNIKWNNLKVSTLKCIADGIGVDTFTSVKTKKGTFKSKTKNVLIHDIQFLLKLDECKGKHFDSSVIILNQNIRNPLRIKDFFSFKPEMFDFINGSIPLLEEEFLNFTTKRGVAYRDIFNYQLNLVVKDTKNGTTVTAIPDENSKKIEQGVYLLSVKNQFHQWVIIKIGSFAETQGMSKRIQSFGGGNHETGSATNKWFQRAIKYFISCELECRFTYRLKFVKNTIDDDPMYDEPEEIKPYYIRKAETRAFEVHNLLNNGNCPIFGENCT